MIVKLLRLWLRHMDWQTEQSRQAAVHVDRMEVNHYWWAAGCESHQVILWQWSDKESQFKAQRFFFLTDELGDLPCRVNGRWRFTYRNKKRSGRLQIFETNDLIETVTAHDPWHRARAS